MEETPLIRLAGLVQKYAGTKTIQEIADEVDGAVVGRTTDEHPTEFIFFPWVPVKGDVRLFYQGIYPKSNIKFRMYTFPKEEIIGYIRTFLIRLRMDGTNRGEPYIPPLLKLMSGVLSEDGTRRVIKNVSKWVTRSINENIVTGFGFNELSSISTVNPNTVHNLLKEDFDIPQVVNLMWNRDISTLQASVGEVVTFIFNQAKKELIQNIEVGMLEELSARKGKDFSSFINDLNQRNLLPFKTTPRMTKRDIRDNFAKVFLTWRQAPEKVDLQYLFEYIFLLDPTSNKMPEKDLENKMKSKVFDDVLAQIKDFDPGLLEERIQNATGTFSPRNKNLLKFMQAFLETTSISVATEPSQKVKYYIDASKAIIGTEVLVMLVPTNTVVGMYRPENFKKIQQLAN